MIGIPFADRRGQLSTLFLTLLRAKRGLDPLNRGLEEARTMERYKNLGGDSGVVGYEIGDTFIEVQFSDESVYLYDYQSAGSDNIEEMKRLATAGRGLNSFINRAVRKKYASKLK